MSVTEVVNNRANPATAWKSDDIHIVFNRDRLVLGLSKAEAIALAAQITEAVGSAPSECHEK